MSRLSDPKGRLELLRGLMVFSVLSTAIHFTHNFVAADQYPDDLVAADTVKVGVILSWPTLTAIGLLGYRFYSRGRYREAHPALLVYSILGISTLGHFLDGSPDIPAFFYATIFTDGLAGFAIAAFTIWSMRVTRGEPAASSAGSRRATPRTEAPR